MQDSDSPSGKKLSPILEIDDSRSGEPTGSFRPGAGAGALVAARGGGALAAEADLYRFFFTQIERAVGRRRPPLSVGIISYLSGLLVEQAHAGAPAAGHTPLAELRREAMFASPSEAAAIWRRLGDYALVIAGFFEESLRRRSVDRSYYEQMGATAYRQVESRLWSGGSGLFGELSHRFHVCTEVLLEVKEEVRDEHDNDVLRLYERWVSTGSSRVAERLRALGVVPVRRSERG